MLAQFSFNILEQIRQIVFHKIICLNEFYCTTQIALKIPQHTNQPGKVLCHQAKKWQ